MSIERKYSISVIIALLCAALAAVLMFVSGTAGFAHAEDTATVELTPIRSESSDITYQCFDNPVSLYADSIGILVANKNSVVAVSGEAEITARRYIPADKVYRHIEHGDHSEYLIVLADGTLTAYCGESDGVIFPFDNEIVDFTVESDTLYALTSSSITIVPLGAETFISDSATVTSFTSDKHVNVTATAITVLNGRIYVAVNSAFGNKQDICTADDGKLTVLHMQSDNIISLAADAGTVYALTRDELAGYTTSITGAVKLIKNYSARGALFTSIYAYGGNVYAIDTLNAVHKLEADLISDSTILASASFAKGFFNMPTGVAVKNSTMYVADSVNGRIAVYGDDVSYAKREFVNPVSVASDSAGTVYVAYEYGKVGIFVSGDFSAANEKTIEDVGIGNVYQVLVDAEKTLYILSDTGIWTVESGYAPAILVEGRYKSVALSVGKDRLYALTDDKIVAIDEEGNVENYCNAPDDAVSFAVDMADSAFILSPASITVYKDGAYSEYVMTCGDEAYTLGGRAGHVALCAVENKFVTHGDVIITDTYKHRIFKLDGIAELGAKLVDDNYEAPDIVNDTTPDYYGLGLIRTALRNADVFSLPMETSSIFTIAAGRRVIVPYYDLDETKEYSLILIDDLENGKLIQGYVYKDALSEPLPYTAPPSDIGTVFNAATPVYKWPSRNAKTVRGYSAVNQNTEFKMLNFVESYRDDYGYLWYRISLDNGCEGFILAINISTMSYEPVFIHPAYDAAIISYKDSTFAVGYKIENGEYVKIAELPTGTQIEIIGAFDSSKRYTQVKFLDPDLGTLTCYVETVYIKYKGVNIVLIVALIVIAVTVILAAIIIGRVMHNKRKRLETEKD